MRVQSFGFEKVRLTVVFGARADGTKLRPCPMEKGNVFSVCVQDGVPVLTNKNAWMDGEYVIRNIDYMFPFIQPNRLIIVFDSARSHISKKVKSYLQERKILFAVIPSRMTAFMQPCDTASSSHSKIVWWRSPTN